MSRFRRPTCARYVQRRELSLDDRVADECRLPGGMARDGSYNFGDSAMEHVNSELFAAIGYFASGVVLLGIVPLVVVKLVLRERLADYGVRRGDLRFAVDLQRAGRAADCGHRLFFGADRRNFRPCIR